MKTINGYSEERITSMMRRWEKLIAWYNQRDNFQTESVGTEAEKREYRMALKIWDTLKSRRDQLS